MVLIFIATIFLSISTVSLTNEGICSIELNGLNGTEPFYLRPEWRNDNNENYLVNSVNGRLTLKRGEYVEVVCPDPVSKSNKIVGRAVCRHNNELMYNNSIHFDKIMCPASKNIIPSARTGGKCLETQTQIDVGFLVDSTFINQIQICYNNQTRQPLYASSLLSRSVGICASERPPWYNKGTFHIDLPVSIDYLYRRDVQQRTINRLLGFKNNDTTYISTVSSSQNYFAKGHLTPKCDFVYNAQQCLTHNYYNAAPQWQVYNGRNWKKLEARIRKFLKESPLKEVRIYTGTHSTTKFYDHSGKLTEIALYVSHNKRNKALMVPGFFWKIISEPVSKNCTAFVINNSPFRVNITSLCRSVCEQIQWLKGNFNPNDVSAGYLVCCSINQLKKKIRNIPDMDCTGLLK